MSGLWCITSYFNPAGYRSRARNYRVFRQHLDAPLLTVEWSRDGTFELGKDDADILVQVSGGDVMWQKERLLNLALDALPDACRSVAWVDCDVVFASDDWPERTERLLEEVALVQLFSDLHDMPSGWRPGAAPATPVKTRHPDSVFLAAGISLEECFGAPTGVLKRCPGMALAARRELLEAHRFYDACILGGGDGALIRAAYGRIDDAMRIQAMGGAKRVHFRAWAEPFFAAVQGRVTFLEGELLHLWHGAVESRRYDARHRDLVPFEFDPFTDVALTPSGTWRWSSDKPAMHSLVADYFRSRSEDS